MTDVPPPEPAQDPLAKPPIRSPPSKAPPVKEISVDGEDEGGASKEGQDGHMHEDQKPLLNK